MNSREVFRADWKATKRRERRVDWLGRTLEWLCVAFVVFLICLRW